MRILIIESKKALVGEYLRIFNHMLVGDYDFTHVPTIEAAIPAIESENWDAILVDSDLGAPCVFPIGASEEDGLKISTGYEIVKMRREVEEAMPEVDRSFIMAIATNQVALTLFQGVGADTGFLKLDIPKMARVIEELSK